MPPDNFTPGTPAAAPQGAGAPSSSPPTVAEVSAISQMFEQSGGGGAPPASQPPSPAPAPAGQPPTIPFTPAPAPFNTGAAPAAAAPQPSAYARQAAELGIELPATASDADVFTALQTRLREVAPLAQYAQALLPHADAINEFFASRSTGAQPPQAQSAPPTQDQWDIDKHFNQHWPAPRLTPEMQYVMNQGLVVRDPETGVLQAKPGYEVMVAPLLQPLNQAVNWERDAVRDFFQGNPIRKTFDAIKDPIERLIDAKVEQRLQMTRSQDVAVNGINQFEAQNQSWMYQPSASGQRMLTPYGQQFVQLVKQNAAHWTGPAEALLSQCRDIVELQAIRAGGVARTNGAAQTGISSPLTAAPPAPAPQQQSFLQNALYQPSGGANPVQSPTGPVAVTQRELENMFVNDFQAARGAAA